MPVNAPQQQFVSRPVQEIFGYRPGYGFAGFAVNTAIGNYTHTDVDLGFPGGLLGLLDATRSYNSLNTAGGRWVAAGLGRTARSWRRPPAMLPGRWRSTTRTAGC